MCRPMTRAKRRSTSRHARPLRRNRSRCAVREHTFSAVKIYTKTGDAGETGLFGGGRVPKDDARVDAYGQVDELNAALGAAVAQEPGDFELTALQTIQRDLFAIGAELATPDPGKQRAKVTTNQVEALERLIDAHEARTPCRRAERAVVSLARDQQINPLIIHYLNRLSDLLFVLARAVNKQAGRADIAW